MKGEKQKTKESCPQRNSAERERYEGAPTLIGIVGDELVEVQLSSDRMLEYILTPDNLNRAYRQVKANKGSGGIDIMEVDQLLPYLREHKDELPESLLGGRYRPNPVRRVEIPKEGGKTRQLGIPTVVDRVIQQSIAQVLSLVYEPKFSETSYGFRPRRSAQQAVRKAQEIINDFPQKRIFPQIAPDGRQPHELQRTLAFHYSQYNLTHFIDIMLMAKNLGIKLDDITSTDGRNFYKAMDFLASYVGKGLSEWPYQQISGWESSIQNFCKDLYRTAVYLNPARKDYLNLYYAHRILKPHDNFNLLYIQATALDNPIRK